MIALWILAGVMGYLFIGFLLCLVIDMVIGDVETSQLQWIMFGWLGLLVWYIGQALWNAAKQLFNAG